MNSAMNDTTALDQTSCEIPSAILLTTHFRTSSTASIATMNGTMNSHTRPGIGAVPKIARPHGV